MPPAKAAIVPEPTITRTSLVADIESCKTLADLNLLAPGILKAKNKLSAGDSKEVEVAFAARLMALDPQSDTLTLGEGNHASVPANTVDDLSAVNGASIKKKRQVGRQTKGEPKARAKARVGIVASNVRREYTDPSMDSEVASGGLAIPKLRYLRDKAHLRFVASNPCLICERRPADAHHLRFAQPQALGRKVSDEFTVPLCRAHYRDNHRVGDERAWWSRALIDPIEVSQRLWAKSHQN